MSSNIQKFIKGIIICRESGEYLLDLILDSEINPMLLSSFVGALSLFGKDNLGKIEEIEIKGLDVGMVIVYKYNLILITIMAKDFMKNNIRGEAEKTLDMFYSSYSEEINDANGCLDLSIFNDFKKLLYFQIQDYFELINDKKRENEVGDYGFFTPFLRKLRNGQSQKESS
ncbi:MAG: hypothetical protein ACTSP6_10035 [Promethearchaeota archaeon]